MDLFPLVETKLSKLKRRLANEGIDNLLDLNYERYLRTTLWKVIKKSIIQRDNYKCQICSVEKSKFKEFEVHHRSYELDVLEGRNSEMLITLCPRCHKLIEFSSDGAKRVSMAEKDKMYYYLSQLHAAIENNGLPLQIHENNKRNYVLYDIEFIGNKEHLIFYSFDSLLFGFVINFCCDHLSDLKLPKLFGVEKFYQKHGAKILDKTTNKEVVNVKKIEDRCIIKSKNKFKYLIYTYFTSYISEQIFWHIV